MTWRRVLWAAVFLVLVGLAATAFEAGRVRRHAASEVVGAPAWCAEFRMGALAEARRVHSHFPAFRSVPADVLLTPLPEAQELSIALAQQAFAGRSKADWDLLVGLLERADLVSRCAAEFSLDDLKPLGALHARVRGLRGQGRVLRHWKTPALAVADPNWVSTSAVLGRSLQGVRQRLLDERSFELASPWQRLVGWRGWLDADRDLDQLDRWGVQVAAGEMPEESRRPRLRVAGEVLRGFAQAGW